MNYRNENATPQSRFEDCAFSQTSRQNHGHGYCGLSAQNCSSCRKNSHLSSCAAEKCVSRSVSQRSSSICNKKGRCGSDNGFLHREAPIAMVYSPVQQWKELYDPHTALSNGTIFKELDLPFYPTPCKRKENSTCQCR